MCTTARMRAHSIAHPTPNAPRPPTHSPTTPPSPPQQHAPAHPYCSPPTQPPTCAPARPAHPTHLYSRVSQELVAWHQCTLLTSLGRTRVERVTMPWRLTSSERNCGEREKGAPGMCVSSRGGPREGEASLRQRWQAAEGGLGVKGRATAGAVRGWRAGCWLRDTGEGRES